MKRKSAERDAAEGDADTAYASQEETARAILSVLRVRQQFLQSKGAVDMRHVLTDDQRRELVQRVRQEREQSDHQRALQQRDADEGKASKGREEAGKGSKARKGSKVSKRSKAQETGKGNANKQFVREQKRKRFHRHLQRIAGAKQIW
eukprot:7464944-Pyramimonas_sp.AAC.1